MKVHQTVIFLLSLLVVARSVSLDELYMPSTDVIDSIELFIKSGTMSISQIEDSIKILSELRQDHEDFRAKVHERLSKRFEDCVVVASQANCTELEQKRENLRKLQERNQELSSSNELVHGSSDLSHFEESLDAERIQANTSERHYNSSKQKLDFDIRVVEEAVHIISAFYQIGELSKLAEEEKQAKQENNEATLVAVRQKINKIFEKVKRKNLVQKFASANLQKQERAKYSGISAFLQKAMNRLGKQEDISEPATTSLDRSQEIERVKEIVNILRSLGDKLKEKLNELENESNSKFQESINKQKELTTQIEDLKARKQTLENELEANKESINQNETIINHCDHRAFKENKECDQFTNKEKQLNEDIDSHIGKIDEILNHLRDLDRTLSQQEAQHQQEHQQGEANSQESNQNEEGQKQPQQQEQQQEQQPEVHQTEEQHHEGEGEAAKSE